MDQVGLNLFDSKASDRVVSPIVLLQGVCSGHIVDARENAVVSFVVWDELPLYMCS